MFENFVENLQWIRDLYKTAPYESITEYYQVHEGRFAHTLGYLSPLQFSEGIELGSDGFLVHAARLMLGGNVRMRGATFDPRHPPHFDHVFWGDATQTSFEMLNFNLQDDRMPLPDGSLDFVAMCEILEHMPADPMHVLSEVNRVLRPGGILLLTTPNGAGALTLRRILAGEPPWIYYKFGRNRTIYRHCFEYTVGVLRECLDCAGFSEQILTTHSCWSSPEPVELVMLRGRIREDLIGDNIFAVATKISPLKERWPSVLYA
jgi:hypothetical protein